MTLVAVAGNLILSILPQAVLSALNYLLPALFGAMCMQRIMMDYRSAAIVVPCACVLRLLSTKGVFNSLPLGGGYAQILLCVFIGVFTAKMLHGKSSKRCRENNCIWDRMYGVIAALGHDSFASLQKRK